MKKLINFIYIFGFLFFIGIINVDALASVKINDTKTIYIDVTTLNTVSDLKMKIYNEEDIPLLEQRLYFNNKLCENGKSLASYNINNSSNLELKRMDTQVDSIEIKELDIPRETIKKDDFILNNALYDDSKITYEIKYLHKKSNNNYEDTFTKFILGESYAYEVTINLLDAYYYADEVEVIINNKPFTISSDGTDKLKVIYDFDNVAYSYTFLENTDKPNGIEKEFTSLFFIIDGNLGLLEEINVGNITFKKEDFNIIKSDMRVELNDQGLKKLNELYTGEYNVNFKFKDKEELVSCKLAINEKKVLENEGVVPDTNDHILKSLVFGNISILGVLVVAVYIVKKKAI